MRPFAVVLALSLVAAACGGSGSEEPTTSVPPGATTTRQADAVTTTTSVAPPAEARFVISRVVFGEAGYVSITNAGDTAGNLEGWQLCQRPAYYAIGSLEVAPGETVHFATGEVAGLAGQVVNANGRFGRFNASSGEIGLYADGSFGSASSIRSYVEWGSSDHGRSSVAVAAGIWAEGGFVPAEGAPGLVSTVPVPTAPEEWATS